MTFLLILKYATLAITVGTAFVGTWFFEFTKTDKDTGKRSLTVGGKRAIVFAGMALVSNFIITVWTDREASIKQKEADTKSSVQRQIADNERAEAASYRKKFENGQQETIKLINLIRENIDKFDTAGKREVVDVVRSLSTIDDYKKEYPDLFNKITTARSFGDLEKAINEGIALKVAQRVSNKSECRNVPIRQWSDTPVRTGTILVPPGASQRVSFTITGEGVDLEVSDLSRANDVSEGYKFVFLDGSETPKLTCDKLKTNTSCIDSTFDSSAVKEVYKTLQNKIVAKIIMDKKAYDVEPSVGKTMMATFSCIAP